MLFKKRNQIDIYTRKNKQNSLLDKINSDVKYRIFIVFCFIVFCNAIFALKISNLAFSGQEKSFYNINKYKKDFSFTRNDIIDSNGVLIATNLTTFSSYIDPKKIFDSTTAAKQINYFFPKLITAESIEKFKKNNKRFVWIKRRLIPSEYKALNKVGIQGMSFMREEQRVYPHSHMLSHILGYVNQGGEGVSGVEGYFDRDLKSNLGTPLQLSIDVRVQNSVKKELLNQMIKYEAQSAAAVVMNVKNGEIISLVSLPDFDSNNPAQYGGNRLFNHASLGVYEIGSILKILTASIALETKTFSLEDKIDVSRPLRVGNNIIRDYSTYNGELNMEDILRRSSNVGIAQIALQIPREEFKLYMDKFGLFEKTNIELLEKAKPLVPKRWDSSDVAAMSYGYGIAITLVHAAETIASIVNDGVKFNASIIKSNQKKKGERLISKETSEIMRKMLYISLNEGTGFRARIKGYCVGGKTGTADKIKNNKYDKNSSVVSFAATFPMYDPQYVVVLLIDEPKKIDKSTKITGGRIAAPVAARIIASLSAIKNIIVDDNLCVF